MNRREFTTLLGGAAAAWPFPTLAQQFAKLRTIGFLGAATPSDGSAWLTDFEQRLRELGWIDGSNITIEVRWAEGRADRAAEIAAEFVRQKVELLVTWSNQMALAAQRATSTIPIVFATATDAIGTGLVASLARPGGNVTGLSSFNIDIVGKRVELLHEIATKLDRLAILVNDGSPSALLEMRQI